MAFWKRNHRSGGLVVDGGGCRRRETNFVVAGRRRRNLKASTGLRHPAATTERAAEKEDLPVALANSVGHGTRKAKEGRRTTTSASLVVLALGGRRQERDLVVQAADPAVPRRLHRGVVVAKVQPSRADEA